MKNLNKTIDEYCELKELEKRNKKTISKLNTELKQYMLQGNLKDTSSDVWKINYQVRSSESMNESKVIDILEKYEIPGIIKTKKYIDEDALESAIYNQQLSKDILMELDTCKEVSTTTALTYEKVNKEALNVH